jgi:lysozyme family protein
MVADFYRAGYWGPLEGLPDRIRMKAFDIAVNAGQGRAVKILQEALNGLEAGLKVDGVLGPRTFGALGWAPEDAVLEGMRARQAAYYKNLAAKRPALAKFLNGWLKRAAWAPE